MSDYGTSRYPGPTELHTELLTRSELAAMLEHVIYRAKGDTRSMLQAAMPDAYSRLVRGESLEPTP